MSQNTMQRIADGIALNRQFGRTGPHWDGQVVAYETLQGELDRRSSIGCELEFDVRDTLLAHGRQDAAHTLCNTAALLKSVQSLRRMVIANLILIGGLL